MRGVRTRTGDDAHDRQVEGGRELEVALVVAGNGHDRAGAVLHQHVVGDPHRDRPLRGRVDGVRAGEDARLLLAHFARDDVLLRRVRDVRLDRLALLVGRETVEQGMLGRDDEIRRAEDRVRPSREDANVDRTERVFAAQPDLGRRRARELLEILHAEDDFGPVGAPDPVALRLFCRVGPVQMVQVGEQPSGVVGDPEEPLLQEPLLDPGAAALALAGDDLLVGEDGLVVGAPVDGRALLVRQAALIKL